MVARKGGKVKFEPKNPPRSFEVGYESRTKIFDCGSVFLDENEQITFHTEAGGQYDVAKKSWGFYATPSTNGRLSGFGLRTVLTRNRDNRYFVLLVEKGKEKDFWSYVETEPLTIVCWLDETTTLQRIEELFRADHGRR